MLSVPRRKEESDVGIASVQCVEEDYCIQHCKGIVQLNLSTMHSCFNLIYFVFKIACQLWEQYGDVRTIYNVLLTVIHFHAFNTNENGNSIVAGL